MDPETILATIIIVALSGFIQGLVGFGSALVAVPLLSIYIDPRIVVPFVLVHGLVMNMYLSFGNRDHIQKRRVLPLFVAAVFGIIPGAFVLIIFSAGAIRLLIGIVIILFSIALMTGRTFRTKREGKAMVPVGFISGLLNGSISMSGPPVILFLSNQGVKRKSFRANLVTYFFLINIVTLIIFTLTGVLTEGILLISAAFLPALPAGVIFGEWVSSRIKEGPFRRLALLVVMAAGVSALLSGILSLV